MALDVAVGPRAVAGVSRRRSDVDADPCATAVLRRITLMPIVACLRADNGAQRINRARVTNCDFLIPDNMQLRIDLVKVDNDERRVAIPSGTLRVGNGAGFWGDNLDAPYLLARDGRLDVLTLEYLAELTMAILSHLRTKDPAAGYVTDFPELVERLAPILREQPGLRIVTNAGGLNPRRARRAAAGSCAGAGLERRPSGWSPATTCWTGFPDGSSEGLDLAHLETGEPIASVAERLVAANVYLGARPIAEALQGGSRDRADRPGRRCLVDPRSGGGPFRLGVGRLEPAGRARRPPAT